MDQIKSQISSIDPLAQEPEAEINGEEALARMLTGPRVFSDTVPAGVSSLQDRRNRKVRIAGALLLGAAAVTAGVLVAANFGPISSTPAPAVTVTTPEPTPTPSVSATSSASASATPSGAPTPVTPTQSAPAIVPPVAPTPTPTVPPVAALQKFTFPDGHISFNYPSGWTVRTEQGPYLSEETKAASQGATLLDSAGAEVARINSGFYGDGTGGLVDRTVLDRAVVPGVTDTAGNQVEFGFSLNQIMNIDYDAANGGMPTAKGPSDSPPFYVMDVRLSSELQPGQTTSGTNQIRMPNGFMNAYVVFDFDKQPTFATPEAAKAWMGSTQYAQLKAMLLSVSYN
ncbi:hypothetical protein [Arthrobacter sp. NtRootA1]|uniref:hypothetical protein n=1 Tax=Arthrobacter sp. NtRootA1 TaxID=2830983 RepID=UPI001CC570B8|nr:hypothetical protein [Arthrobacter sp. NtRootA1]BCW04046.1 hypothetical protein NtRootA1_01840 [Arthrobacter sp. NtRootA1]